jgi:hypothetical protein
MRGEKMKTLIFAVLLAFGIFGCHTNQPPEIVGSFAGKIVLYDSTGTILSNYSGVKIKSDSSTFDSTATDSLGQWRINNVSDGSYNITASKSGFGTYHWYQQAMSGGTNNLQEAAIAQAPNITANLNINSIAWFDSIENWINHDTSSTRDSIINWEQTNFYNIYSDGNNLVWFSLDSLYSKLNYQLYVSHPFKYCFYCELDSNVEPQDSHLLVSDPF